MHLGRSLGLGLGMVAKPMGNFFLSLREVLGLLGFGPIKLGSW